MKEYDVIVVGGGPAGNFAAYNIAKEGYRVAVLDKKREIGSPVRCGEAVGIGGLSMATDMILDDWIDYRIDGGRIIAPNGIALTINTDDDYGLILDRKKFDKFFAELAMDFGVDYFLDAYAISVIKKDENIVGVRANIKGDDLSIFSSIVIGADGVESRLAKSAGIDTTLPLKDIEICAQYMVGGMDIKDNKVNFYTGRNNAPGGYAWMFPKSKNTANIGLGVSGIEASKKSPLSYLDEFMERNFPNAKPLSRIVGAVPVSKRVDNIVANNFMLVGDAARQINALAGGGITFGLNAAKMAAFTACKALAKSDCSKKKLMAYQEEWDSSIGKQQKRSYKIKEAVSKIDDSILNKTATKLQKYETLSYMKIFKTLLINKPSLAITAIEMFFK